jgi:hypothetical protein
MVSITRKFHKLWSYKLYKLIDKNVSLKKIKTIIHQLDYSSPGKGEISGKLACDDIFFSSAKHGRTLTPILIHIIKKRTDRDGNYSYNVFKAVIDAVETKKSKCKDLIDARDRNGWTALHWAAVFGYKDMVGLLLKAGADVGLETKDGDTPLVLAESQANYTANNYTAEELADFEKIKKMLTNDKVDDATPNPVSAEEIQWIEESPSPVSAEEESKPLFEETNNTPELPGTTQPGHKHFTSSKFPAHVLISPYQRSQSAHKRHQEPTVPVSRKLKHSQKSVKESQSRRKNEDSPDFTAVGGKPSKKTRRNRKSKK